MKKAHGLLHPGRIRAAVVGSLRAEIDREAWQSLRSDMSRPFRKPASGRIAVKAIDPLGDEVMKATAVE